MHCLSGQHHDALRGCELLHPGILCLAGIAQRLVRLLVLTAHAFPPLPSLPPNDLHSHSLIWMLSLQTRNRVEEGDLVLSIPAGSSSLC